MPATHFAASLQPTILGKMVLTKLDSTYPNAHLHFYSTLQG